MIRYPLFIALFTALFFAGCDSNASDDTNCLAVSPQEDYSLSGTAMSMDFLPASKIYTVRNTCDTAVMLSVEEDVRWLDVDIQAFGGGGAESGPVNAGIVIDVVVELRYGTDDPERLDQLAAGNYSAELRFVDETNDGQITRMVDLTVNPQ